MKKFYPNPRRIPPSLSAEAEEQWGRFLEAAAAKDIDAGPALEFEDEALRVWPFSDFIVRSCISAPDLLPGLAESGDLNSSYADSTYETRLSALSDSASNDDSLSTVLRAFRNREMVRIAWRDISGRADLAETMMDLSLLAEACLSCACSLIHRWLSDEFGEPVSNSGRPQQLVVTAMGKLGARELNFSSDIDLIFSFPEHGNTSGSAKTISCDQFFTRLCRRLISVIGTARADGLVFRVDTRLRPWGDSGPLCMSFDAMESYYESQGRDWERYAWIKARPVAGDIEAGRELLDRLSPFVFRRYLDYSAFEALREMKAMIEAETRRKGMSDNVKLGPGGIREVEFIAQAFQLLQGGRDADLRNPVLLEVLPILAQRDILPETVCRELEDAYIFLRNTEHRLQEYQDRQTQLLPSEHHMQERIALSMGFAGWETFRWQLASQMETVHSHFHALFLRTDSTDEKDQAVHVWQAVTSGSFRQPDGSLDPGFTRMLKGLGYEDPAAAASIMEGIAEAREVKSMLPQGRRRLDSLMPKIIKSAAASGRPVQAMKIMAAIIQVIARRTVYINLLDENPEAIDHLLRLCTASPWITSFITRRPVVLDELLDPRTLYSPPDRQELEHLLQVRFSSIPPDDLEMQMDELRMFRQAAVMRIAAADITDAIPLMRVSDYLTETAEVITAQVLELSCTQMVEKFLKVRPEPGRCRRWENFLIVGYGKFGGIELGYGSDLDLVFLHGDGGVSDHNFEEESPLLYTRVGQRIIHIMTTRTSAGILYSTDMRLRPGGESGPLVCSMERFGQYLKDEAWTWEHQALIRARPVAGSETLARDFHKIRKEILTIRRDEEVLRAEVCAMRQRMVKGHGKKLDNGIFDLKRGRGGIVDIEFIVQYLVLLNAFRHEELCQWTDNMRLIDTLETNDILDATQADLLRHSYITFREAVHRLSLQEKPARIPLAEVDQEVKGVRDIWERFMGS